MYLSKLAFFMQKSALFYDFNRNDLKKIEVIRNLNLLDINFKGIKIRNSPDIDFTSKNIIQFIFRFKKKCIFALALNKSVYFAFHNS